MSTKTSNDSYGYDRHSDTVRVGRHDRWRLLLMFRNLTERQDRRSWTHMHDYDVSF